MDPDLNPMHDQNAPSGPDSAHQTNAHHAEVVRATTVEPHRPLVVVQQASGGFFRFFSWLGWLGLFLCVPALMGLLASSRDYLDTTGGIQEKYHSLAKKADDKVAVIDVTGVIMDGNGFVKHQIDRVRDDDAVKAVVVRVDSPGGTITGSDYILHHLNRLKDEKQIPLVVSMGGIAASGGYYVAMAVGDEPRSIFAEPTTTTGSIGVIIPHYDISGLLNRYDIKNDSIASHPRKQMLSMTKEMAPEDRTILEGYVNESFVRFKDIVLQGRPAYRDNTEALDALATGEIFTAGRGQGNGLSG